MYTCQQAPDSVSTLKKSVQSVLANRIASTEISLDYPAQKQPIPEEMALPEGYDAGHQCRRRMLSENCRHDPNDASPIIGRGESSTKR